MYVHTPFPNNVYALDLNNDGKILWKYEPKQDPNVIPVMCCDTVNRGVAYADGKIFLIRPTRRSSRSTPRPARSIWSVEERRSDQGRDRTPAPACRSRTRCWSAFPAANSACAAISPPMTSRPARWSGAAIRRARTTRSLIDPEKTTELGKPVGKDSSLNTWKGDQWKIGGGATWGWYSYDPELNLIYYGIGNPSTWNPKQRPGDNKWSMTDLRPRSPIPAMAKWVYQMTPHDEWDYDGINEMILADQKIDGKERKLLVHFDRNGFGYTLDRANGELLVAEKYDPAVNWATKVDMDKSSKTYGRPEVVAKYSTEHNGEDVNYQGHLPGGAWHQGRAAGGLLARDRPVLRADQPRLHGLRALPGELYRRPALCRRDPVDVSAAGRQTQHGQLHRLGRHQGQDRLVRSGAVLGLVGRARDRRRRGLLRHARRLSEGGRRQDGQGALQVQDPVGHHRQRHDL